MESRYLAFLLRLWRVNDEDYSIWRASLENPHTGERHAFATIEDLFTFLGTETRALTRQDAGVSETDQRSQTPA